MQLTNIKKVSHVEAMLGEMPWGLACLFKASNSKVFGSCEPPPGMPQRRILIPKVSSLTLS